MEIKSITRIDGKIRIVSANSAHERVDDFEDYGLPEVDHLIKSFLEHNVVFDLEALEAFGEYHYEFGDCYYIDYSYIHISTPKSKSCKCIDIEKRTTTIGYKTFTCMLYGCVRFTTDILRWKWAMYSWLDSKIFIKQFDGKHITEQSLEKYAAAVGYSVFRLNMEITIGHRLCDIPTKLNKFRIIR